MSRSNYDKPFYVDVGTSIAAVRCASNHDVLVRSDHVLCGQRVIKEVEELCDRLNKEAEEWRGKTANPPMGEAPVDEPKPLSPDAPQMAQGEDRHMSAPEAMQILMELGRKRSMSIDQVDALEMGARRLFNRHFQKQRNWAKRREARKAEGEVAS